VFRTHNVSTDNGFDNRSSPIINCAKVAIVINIMSINVCDLVSKMKCIEFILEIQKYDIICSLHEKFGQKCIPYIFRMILCTKDISSLASKCDSFCMSCH
jgi:hypothetical protein